MLWLAALLSVALAKEKDSLDNSFGHRQVCAGVYGPDDAHGPFTPSVNVSIPSKSGEGEIAVIVYDYGDIDKIGYTAKSGDYIYRKYMCDQQSVYANECSEEDLGRFIISGKPQAEIKNEIVKIGEKGGNGDFNLQYLVKKTGFYCVAAEATPGHESMKFDVEVGFQNAYGHLPGRDHPLILFHFVQSMVYLGIFLIWLVPLVVYRQSILKVQIHLTVLLVLMFLEQLLVAAYYFVMNKKGHGALTNFFLVFSSLWASGRLAYTFFMLIIVAYGYSVVHPSLGPNMRRAQLLAGALFVFGFVYSIMNYYTDEAKSTGSWFEFMTNVMFMPFMALLALCYFVALHAMRETLAYLTSRKQMAKVQMYRFVVYVLAGALIAIALQLVFMIVQLFAVPLKSIINSYWRSEWVVYDGWPNIVYCVSFVLILILWRPNRDNMRYAMSTQLAQNENDADEFEIGSLNGSDDDLEIPTGDDYFEREEPQFDAEAHHDLSDLEHGDEFEVNVEDRNLPGDEEDLVQAPTANLKNRW